MKKTKTNATRMIGLMALALMLGCAGSSDVIRTEVNGQVYESKVQSVNCFTGAIVDVEISSPLSCNISFITKNFYADLLVLTVSDIKPIYDSAIGRWLPIMTGSINVTATLQGIPQQISGGRVRFNRISNVRGDDVCADIEVFTGSGQIDGNFCGVLQTGI